VLAVIEQLSDPREMMPREVAVLLIAIGAAVGVAIGFLAFVIA
jgi:hypothetical protein